MGRFVKLLILFGFMESCNFSFFRQVESEDKIVFRKYFLMFRRTCYLHKEGILMSNLA